MNNAQIVRLCLCVLFFVLPGVVSGQAVGSGGAGGVGGFGGKAGPTLGDSDGLALPGKKGCTNCGDVDGGSGIFGTMTGGSATASGLPAAMLLCAEEQASIAEANKDLWQALSSLLDEETLDKVSEMEAKLTAAARLKVRSHLIMEWTKHRAK